MEDSEQWYLERSEPSGSHKFYEVTLEGVRLVLRYGRIGDPGATQEKLFATPEAARLEAEKRVSAKRKSGYEDAVLGATEKRPARQRYRAAELEEIAAAFAPWREKYAGSTWIPLVSDRKPEPTDSRFCGFPWLGPNESPPRCGCCGQPLQLFLQLNLAHLPEPLLHEFGEGLLQVFYCINEECDLEPGEAAYQPFAKQHLLRLVNPNTEPQSLPEPDGTWRARSIDGWRQEPDLPASQEHEAYGVEYEFEWDDDYMSRVRCAEFGLAFKCLEEEIETEVGEAQVGDKLGWFPRWIQGAKYPTCPKCGDLMRFVFQIDSEDNVPFLFGDCGIAHVTQCRRHLEVLALTWECC